MDDLVAWLREKLDQDEALARAIVARQDRQGAGRSLLAEVEAKRRIVDGCAEVLRFASHYTTVESCDEADAVLAEKVLRLLALPFAGRTGYLEEWRPLDRQGDLPSP